MAVHLSKPPGERPWNQPWLPFFGHFPHLFSKSSCKYVPNLTISHSLHCPYPSLVHLLPPGSWKQPPPWVPYSCFKSPSLFLIHSQRDSVNTWVRSGVSPDLSWLHLTQSKRQSPYIRLHMTCPHDLSDSFSSPLFLPLCILPTQTPCHFLNTLLLWQFPLLGILSPQHCHNYPISPPQVFAQMLLPEASLTTHSKLFPPCSMLSAWFTFLHCRYTL